MFAIDHVFSFINPTSAQIEMTKEKTKDTSKGTLSTLVD